jgi:phosphinothricin acetyltransferase
VETTIYCAPEAVGKRIGTRLYQALFEAIAEENVHQIVAGYTMPNAATAALHDRLGFRPVGVFKEVGYKFGKYWDVAWCERPLRLA